MVTPTSLISSHCYFEASRAAPFTLFMYFFAALCKNLFNPRVYRIREEYHFSWSRNQKADAQSITLQRLRAVTPFRQQTLKLTNKFKFCWSAVRGSTELLSYRKDRDDFSRIPAWASSRSSCCVLRAHKVRRASERKRERGVRRESSCQVPADPRGTWNRLFVRQGRRCPRSAKSITPINDYKLRKAVPHKCWILFTFTPKYNTSLERIVRSPI